MDQTEAAVSSVSSAVDPSCADAAVAATSVQVVVAAAVEMHSAVAEFEL